MPILAGTFKPPLEAANFPDSFVQVAYTGPGLLMVTGDPDPDATGQYKYLDVWNDKPRYERTDGVYQIWWTPYVTKWTFGTRPGETGGNHWRKADPVTGTYDPEGTYTGNPVVNITAVSAIRQRIHGRRGGSGSPPGMYHGSEYQEAVRTTFGEIAREYVDMPLMNAVTFWEHWGLDRNWLCRNGDEKTLHGQAFFPRCAVPPSYGVAERELDPTPDAEVPPVDMATTIRNPNGLEASVYLHFTQPFNSDDYSGLSVFQITPRSRTKSYELKHTRLVGSWKDLTTDGPRWNDFHFDLAWPCITNEELRIFARAYNRCAYLNFGPMTGEGG